MKIVTSPSPSADKSKHVKVNLFANELSEDLENICKQKESMDKDKKMLRIDERTFILVSRERCTPEYAAKMRDKYEKSRKRDY